jgi:hypothetical protein
VIGSRFIEMERLMSRLNNFFSIMDLTCFAAVASLAQSQTQAQQAPKPAETSTMKIEDVCIASACLWPETSSAKLFFEMDNPGGHAA